MKNLIIAFIVLLMASCVSRPEVSNHPRHITLAKYRVGDVFKYPDPKYSDCVARIVNIIDSGSTEYMYQVSLSCADGKIEKWIPQYYLDNFVEE